MIEDPMVVRDGVGTNTNPSQDTVIPFFAILDRVDVNAVSLAAISVTM